MIVAIDPGTTQSAFIFYSYGGSLGNKGIVNNETLVDLIPKWRDRVEFMVVEEVVYGRNVGREVMETVRWSGRFEQAMLPTPTRYLPRDVAKRSLFGKARKITDKDVRAALCRRFGWPLKGKNPEGMATHLWAALAVAVVFCDLRKMEYRRRLI